MSIGAEDALQRAVIQWLTTIRPPWMYWHTPNGGARSEKEGGRLKKLGTLAGVPDLTFLVSRGRTCYIELKVGKGKLSPGQIAFRRYCIEYRIDHELCRSLDQVRHQLQDWGLLDGRGLPVMPPERQVAA